MSREEMTREIARLVKLLRAAANLAIRQKTLIDKLCAADLRTQHLLKKLKEAK